MSHKPRLAVIHYLNTLPLVWGMLHGNEQGVFDLTFSTPSACAEALKRGEVDIGIIPVIEYQRIPDLVVIPEIAIVSQKRVRSLLIFSKCDIREAKTVALDTSSRTSVAVTKVLFGEYYKTHPRFDDCAPDLDSMLRYHDAALLIGDAAMRAQPKNLLVYDLAEQWHEFSGKPLVMAVWAVRRAVADQVSAKTFFDSRAFGMEHLDEIIRSESNRSGWTEEDIREYFTQDLDYSMTSDSVAGVELFFQLAQKHQLITQSRPFTFLSADARLAESNA
ncbi:MAG: menaquinone biosynthesis protein [Acidobacteriia bacterium]|nr:menaquinone biosynthesis protein [Terriglobia bacterium]